MTHDITNSTPISPPSTDNAAKLHALNLQLSEARRDLFRSRTVTRLLRDAYRLDDYSSSVDAVASQFIMLVVENMLCDCAALLRTDRLGGSMFHIVALTGVSQDIINTSIDLKDVPSLFFVPGVVCPADAAKLLLDLLGTSSLLGSLDVATGYALIIGGRVNATIDQNFSANDYEIVEGALAIYIDVLDRRRMRRSLEQARQTAEARDGERKSLVTVLTSKMLTVFNELSRELTVLGYDHAAQIDNAYSCINSMTATLAEGRQTLESAREIFEEAPSSTMLNLEWVYLTSFLLAVVRNAQPAYLQRGIDLRLKPSSHRLRACIDRIWMEVILNSLLEDALLYVEKGAKMVVKAQHCENGAISITIFGRNQLYPSQKTFSTLALEKTLFGKFTASTCRLVDVQGCSLTCERIDTASFRFVLLLSSRNSRRD